MRIISPKALRQFWGRHPEARGAMSRWRQTVGRCAWADFAEVRETFASADTFGPYVIFNIGGNKYRLVAAIHYNTGCLYIRHVLTHAEYDLDKWKQG